MKFFGRSTNRCNCRRRRQRNGFVPAREIRPQGSPDGGDGGRRGSVYAVADLNIDTLIDHPHLHPAPSCAKRREGRLERLLRQGRGRHLPAHAGRHRDSGTRNRNELIADLDEDGKTVMLARGGGRAGQHPLQVERQSRARKRAPWAGRGVNSLTSNSGVPTSGCSPAKLGNPSFIRAVSSARPKVTDYPFHHPFIRISAWSVPAKPQLRDRRRPRPHRGRQMAPASATSSLRHLARTRLLLHLVDVARPCGRPGMTRYHPRRTCASTTRPASTKPLAGAQQRSTDGSRARP